MTLNKIIEEYSDSHKLVLFFSDKKLNLSGFISIHRSDENHPAFGATRIWNFGNLEDALIDSLRLSKTMSKKAAIAGLPCGGAKAVILGDSGRIRDRRKFFRSYAEKVNTLSGNFITGADVGVSQEDVRIMKKFSPYIVGYKVDPVKFTGIGLLYSIQACLGEKFGTEKLNGRSFAIQGAGKIGKELVKLLYPFTKNIFIGDINTLSVKNLKRDYPKIKIVNYMDIHKEKVDVFSPCAMGNSLNKVSIKGLNCSIIVGGANNQLEKEEIANDLHKMNILYAPDYVVNAGGLISVYDEYQYKNSETKRVNERVKIIKRNIERILRESKRKRKPPLEISDRMAREYYDTIL